MCKVNMDLSVEKNLKFAVYSLMLSKHEEFSLNELTEDIMKYQNLDQELLNKKISLSPHLRPKMSSSKIPFSSYISLA